MRSNDLFSKFNIETSSLSLEAMIVPWDTDILGFPVGQINNIKLKGNILVQKLPTDFITWREKQRLKIISCRTKHNNIKETMFLEECGFRFVEMVYPVTLNDVYKVNLPETVMLETASEADLDEIQSIAQEVFSTGRFNIDPRLGTELGGRRYAKWVFNSFNNAKHQIIKASVSNQIVGFFVLEYTGQDMVYWHLTAIASRFHGQGFGNRVWQGMLMKHQKESLKKIQSTISAHNFPVLNLYAKLGFKFESPMMTFHWVAS